MNRREFLKALGIGAAGAALGRGAGTGERETSTTSYQPVVADRSTPSHGLLSDAHPDMVNVVPAHGISTVGVSPGSEIKASDVLTVDDLGFVKPALPGDWAVGFAVADATGETVMVYLDPMVSFNA